MFGKTLWWWRQTFLGLGGAATLTLMVSSAAMAQQRAVGDQPRGVDAVVYSPFDGTDRPPLSDCVIVHLPFGADLGDPETAASISDLIDRAIQIYEWAKGKLKDLVEQPEGEGGQGGGGNKTVIVNCASECTVTVAM